MRDGPPDFQRRQRDAAERRIPPDLDPALDLLSRWLDALFRIPGTEWRVGLDAIIGLVPGIGDTVSAMMSFYILTAATRYGVPRVTMVRMATNVAIDYVIGAIPFAGDVFDVAWKANLKNMELLRRHASAAPLPERRGRLGDWLFIAGIMFCLVALLVGSITVIWYVMRYLFGT